MKFFRKLNFGLKGVYLIVFGITAAVFLAKVTEFPLVRGPIFLRFA